MKIEVILIILFAHFVADFVMQTDQMAINKSKSNWWLAIHVGAYSLSMLILTAWLDAWSPQIIMWVATNGFLHFITDYFTSRMNSKLYQNNMRHWFFVGIGADQFIHYACLLLTFQP